MDHNAHTHVDPKQLEHAQKGWDYFVKFGMYGAASVVVMLILLIFLYMSFLP